jgi:putative hydrolase of the HAD superfamily
MSKIRAIIFDCYSTLIDIKTNEEKDEIFHHLSLYLQYYGAKLNARKLKSALQHEKERYFKSTQERYPEIDIEVVFRNILKKEGVYNAFLTESCCKLFRVLSREKFQLFPDSLPVLEDMEKNGYPVAIISDAQKVFCLDEGDILGISRYFKFILLSTFYGFRKPDPRLFRIAGALLNVPLEEVVYVGNDPETDVKGAKQVNMQAVLLDRKSDFRNPEPEPDFYTTDLWKAWEWIRSSK